MEEAEVRYGRTLDEAVSKVLNGETSRRQFIGRAIALGMTTTGILAVLEACTGGNTSSSSGSGYSLKKYAGAKISVLTDVGETDEKGLQDKLSYIKDTYGITMTVDTLALGPLIAKTTEVLNAATSPYDIINVVAIQVPVWVAAGKFARLNEFINDPNRTPSGYDFNDFPKPSVMNLNWDRDKQTYSADGEINLIPGIHSGSVLAFYRKDLLDKHGLSIPKTWDEWMASAKAMHDPPNVYGCSMVAANDFSLTSVDWWHRFENIGGQLFTGSLKDKSYKPNVNSKEGVQALQMMIDALKYASPHVTTFGFAESVDNMAAGKTGQFVLWSTIAGGIYDQNNSKVFDKIVASTVPTNLSGQKPISFLGGWGLGIPKNSKNIDAAWHLMTYITSREFEKYQVLTYKNDPNRSSIFKDPDVDKIIPSEQEGLNATLGGKIFEGAYTPDYVAMLTVSNAEFNNALLGNQTAAQACGKVQTAWEGIGRKTGWLA